jgi:hypothetical protein
MLSAGMGNWSMNENAQILIRSIERDLAVIEQIYQELGEPVLSPESDYKELIVVAYHLHQLYNAFENIFLNIATSFENAIKEADRWHTELLDRMTLDLLPLRPKLLDDAAYDALDELLRFRHLFRHAYRTRLDAERLQLVLNKAIRLKTLYTHHSHSGENLSKNSNYANSLPERTGNFSEWWAICLRSINFCILYGHSIRKNSQ